jgi:ribosome modulation factor
MEKIESWDQKIDRAFHEGIKAKENGLSPEKNPYSFENLRELRAWRTGWIIGKVINENVSMV